MYEQEQLKKFQKVQVAKDRITLIMQENEDRGNAGAEGEAEKE